MNHCTPRALHVAALLLLGCTALSTGGCTSFGDARRAPAAEFSGDDEGVQRSFGFMNFDQATTDELDGATIPSTGSSYEGSGDTRASTEDDSGAPGQERTGEDRKMIYSGSLALEVARVDEAAAVEDILKIEKELRRLTDEIDSLEGQLRYLDDQIAMSTVTVVFTPVAAPGRPDGPRRASRFWWINMIGAERVLRSF